MTDSATRSEQRADARITYSVSRQVPDELEEAYDAIIQGTIEAVSAFDGNLGARVFRPSHGDRTYRVVIRFDSEGSLGRWKHSDEMRAWAERGDELIGDPPSVANLTGTAQERPRALPITPLQSFMQTSVSGSGLLLLGTALALIMANSPMADRYDAFWATHLTIGTDRFGIDESLRHWVNDALMALFFFILGLEIKREFLVGELRSPRLAALPISAAIGGAVVPALVYIAFTLGSEGVHGWGIPMATDTAFSLGILSVLGSRVPPLLLVFLTAFSIVDDILAVLVIAVFYTDAISWPALALAGGLLGILVVANVAGFHRWPVYAFVGVGVWLAIFQSGVHGTVAGILVALTVPARSWINPSEFLVRARQSIDDFERACYLTPNILTNEPQQQATQTLEHLCEEVETPMTHLQHQLNPWVAYGILPLFAFANAGIPVTSGIGDALGSPVTWGVMAGLVLGKPIGILCFAWLAVRSGVAIRPAAISWAHLGGVALLGGIGFTISLFITELAFGAGDRADAARIGILFASVIAGTVGYVVLRETLAPRRSDDLAHEGATA
jgi:NhaA family Na+:H+ antiporter